MARSIAEARQEYDRLGMMLRAMPDQRDDAAQKIVKRRGQIEAEIAGLEKKSSPSAGYSKTMGLIVALVFGVVAFVAMFYGLR
ncbi:hypothetical protein HH303_10420 [Rhodospirillaceae bacterium KN72]|uniref:Uncharacterized protein n=1 Tax=Pacificispira spongiicola TaxID=2729598 RepID=A0A7Y0E0B6_9PROT|nr:hypothetical protein [Pacificispira spongiicola]NMM44892.1 hypothetical protein [Pacificispira spongiicola]